MGDLKPCPFCGGNRHKIDAGFRGRFVMCLGCFCQTRQKDDDENAIAAWNARATPPEVTALVEALRGIIPAAEAINGAASFDDEIAASIAHDARAALAKIAAMKGGEA